MDRNGPKIEIEVRRGLVSSVRTSAEIGTVEYLVVDYDSEGADEKDVHKDASGDEYVIDGGTTEVEPFVTDALDV